MGFKDKKVVGAAENLFPRIETKIEPKTEKKMTESPTNISTNQQVNELIDISDFAKISLKIAEIKAAEKVEGADKLLKLRIDIGGEMRQIVAGIAKYYMPETLIGKKIVVVTNLKPAKLKGIESNGMLLAASNAESVVLLTPEKDISSGSKVK